MISAEATLFSPEPTAYLPHRFPFLQLDRIISLEPGRAASASKRLSVGEEGWPPVFMVETIAQLGGIAAADAEEGGGGILAAIDRAEFIDLPRVGDSLTISVTIIKSFGPLHLVEGEVSAEDRTLARATVTLKVGKLG